MKKYIFRYKVNIQDTSFEGTTAVRTGAPGDAEKICQIAVTNALRRTGIFALKLDEKSSLAVDPSNIQILELIAEDIGVQFPEDSPGGFVDTTNEEEVPVVRQVRPKKDKLDGIIENKPLRIKDETPPKEVKPKVIKAKSAKEKTGGKVSDVALAAKLIPLCADPVTMIDLVEKTGGIYQKIRYTLFQIKDHGFEGSMYELVQSQLGGKSAFQLVKK